MTHTQLTHRQRIPCMLPQTGEQTLTGVPAATDWRGAIGDAPPLFGGSEHQGRLGVADENVQAEEALHSKSNLLAMSCPTPG